MQKRPDPPNKEEKKSEKEKTGDPGHGEAYFFKGDGQLVFYRFGGDIKTGGYFAVAELLFAAEAVYFPAFIGQGFHHIGHLYADIFFGYNVFGRGIVEAAGKLLEYTGAHALLFYIMEYIVADDGKKIGFNGTVHLQCFGRCQSCRKAS